MSNYGHPNYGVGQCPGGGQYPQGGGNMYLPWPQAPAPPGYNTYPPAMWPQWYPYSVHGLGQQPPAVAAPLDPSVRLAQYGGGSPGLTLPGPMGGPMAIPQLPQLSQSLGPVPAFNPFAGFRRQLVISFDSTTDVAAAASTTVSTVAQDPFQGYRLIVPGSIAQAFLLTDIKIGARSQLSSVGASIPAEAFVPEALSPISFDAACVGQTLSISITNRSGGPQRFLALLYGNALR